MNRTVKLICLLFVTIFVFSACTPMSGSTKFLDENPAEPLYAAYKEFASGKRKVELPSDTTAPPDVNGIIISRSQRNAPRVDIQIANRSHFEITLYGYSWIINETDTLKSVKAIYYNEKTKVSNASYALKYQSEHGGNVPFSFLDGPVDITKDTVLFIFFDYRNVKYVAGVTKNSFIYWPLSQTTE